jgi:hypothetical protein
MRPWIRTPALPQTTSTSLPPTIALPGNTAARSLTVTTNPAGPNSARCSLTRGHSQGSETVLEVFS